MSPRHTDHEHGRRSRGGASQITPTPKRQAHLMNLEAMDEATREYYDSLSPDEQAYYMGHAGRPRPNFDCPMHNTLVHETSVAGACMHEGNCDVLFQLDRPNFENSGIGGQTGATHCAAIDIVAGRKGFLAAATQKVHGRAAPNKVDNDFVLDAARIYISQKANVDGYFRLKPGTVGNTSMKTPQSCIALKADTLRFISRHNIKLVTRTDKQSSQGALCDLKNKKQYGIDICAVNDVASLQPMVKGDNLKKLLTIILQILQQTISSFDTYVKSTRKFHDSIMDHKHMSPFYANLTAPDFINTLPDGINVLIDNVTNVDCGTMSTKLLINQIIFEFLGEGVVEVLEPGQAGGQPNSKNILSPYNSNN